MIVNDLDSGYWHIPNAMTHRTFLEVHSEHEEGSVTFFLVWTVLCLGIKDATHILL